MASQNGASISAYIRLEFKGSREFTKHDLVFVRKLHTTHRTLMMPQKFRWCRLRNIQDQGQLQEEVTSFEV